MIRKNGDKQKHFIPLEVNKDPNSHLMFKENKNPPENYAGV